MEQAQRDAVLLTLKITLFAFIITSPFYNLGSALAFLDNVFAKMLILSLIVGASFVDLQLAIILAIAFFILMMSFNYRVVASKSTGAPAPPRTKEVISPHEPIRTTYPSLLDAGITPAFSGMVIPHNPIDVPTTSIPHVDATPTEDKPSMGLVMQNMYEFPPAECQAPREASDSFMNESIMTYYLDEKIKPYEDFIAQLTNEELLESVSNGAYLGS